MSSQSHTTIQKPKTPEASSPTYRALRHTSTFDSNSGTNEQHFANRNNPLSIRDLKLWAELSPTPFLTQDRPGLNAHAASPVTSNSGSQIVQSRPVNSTSRPDASHDFSRIHIQATPPRVMQTKLAVNQPGDQYEQEAEEVAERAMRMTAPGVSLAPTLPGDNPPGNNSLLRSIGKSASMPEARPIPAPVNEAVSGSGQPLDTTTRAFMEQRLGYDLSLVRIHTSEQDAQSAQSVNALAYTIGRDIVFAHGQYAPETEVGRRLLAHELTHVVQQRAVPVGQTPSQNSHAISKPETETPSPTTSTVPMPTNTQAVGQPTIQRFTTGPQVQRQEQTGTGQPVQKEKSWWEEGTNFSDEMLWKLVREFAPELEPILHKGILVWLEEKIEAAIQSVVNTLMAPVRAAEGVIQSLSKHFSELLIWMQDAGTKLAKGDCSAVTEAAEKIQHVVDGLASPVIEGAKELFQKVGNFFTDVWNQFGAPVWEWLKKVGGEAWEKIQQFGSWLWEKTEPIRSKVESAWTWIKNKLGIGEGPEGQNGLLQWVEDKASKVWESIKQRIEPIKKPLMVVAGVLVMLSPAGPFIAIGAAVGGLISGIRWIRQHMNRPDGITSNREMLQKVILPGIINGIKSFTKKLADIAGSISEKLGQVVGGLGQLIGAVSTSILSFAVSAIQWIADKFQLLVAWATDKLGALVDWVSKGLDRLLHFLQPMFDVLAKVGAVIADILQLPGLIIGKLWNMIPACIRNPIVNFLIEHVLKKVPIFNKLLAIPNIWEKLKARAMEIIHKIFKDGDLTGAVISVFKLLLEVLSVPIELVTGIFSKAANAFDLIVKDPMAFLKNVLGAIKLGFVNFFKNIATHLLAGVADWLFGELLEHGIHRPADFSFMSIFKFVLEILGISAGTIFKKIEEKTSPELARKLRSATKAIGQAWDWVTDLIKEGPGALWKRLTAQIGNLWDIFLDGVISWVEKNIIQAMAQQLLSFLDPTGIMEIVQSLLDIYRAIKSAVKYLEKMLRIINTILDTLVSIASGVLGPAAQMMEDAMDRAMPVVIGFLAGEVGMDDIGDRIKEIVEGVREKVDMALDWLVDGAVKGGNALMGALGLGGDKGDATQQNQQGDVRAVAKTSLLQELKIEHTRSEIEATVGRTFTQLQSQGLKRLEIGPETNTGEVAIFAEASPYEELIKLAPPKRYAILGVTVTLTDEEAPLQGSGVSIPTSLVKGELPQPIEPVAPNVAPRGTSRSDRAGQDKSGGLVVPPEAGSNKVQLVTWNTGQPMEFSNQSHAEKQFVHWLASRPPEWCRRVQRIDVHINVSPCNKCIEEDLIGIQKIVPNLKEAYLVYDEPFTSPPNATTADKLEEMSKVWRVKSTGKPVEGDAEREKTETWKAEL